MTAIPVTTPDSSRKSTSVTVVAWLCIVLSALGTLGALLSVFVLTVAPAATVNAAVNRVAQDTAITSLLPAPYLFMLHHVHLVAAIKLIWWATVLVTSVGVLQRREWARQTFVVVLVIEIAAVIVGFVMGQLIGIGLATRLASRSQSGHVPPGMGSGLALAGLIGIGIVAILLWVLFTFRSARVRAEFASTGRAA